MSRFKLIGTNLLTAGATAAVTSIFWIGAYGTVGGGDDRDITAAGEKVELEQPNVAIAEGLIIGPTGLAIPVIGTKAEELIDTYTQARAGGSRLHDAIDIMAPAGTPVVAAAPGVVEKLYFSEGGGGITAYVRSTDGRWNYYYAHLQAYAPGLREGKRLKQGDPIGTVGSTGNASAAGPHLHFAINRMEPGDDWHEGTPINPYPLLAAREVAAG